MKLISPLKSGLTKDSLKSMAIFFLIIFLSLFLFVDVEVQQKHRLIKDVWNSGHLFLFALVSYGYFSLDSKANHSITYKIIFTTIICLILGSAIEVIQLLFHRDFSINDIINDLLGGYIGLLTLAIFNKQQTTKLKTTALLLIIFCFAAGLRNMEKHLLDEWNMRQQFPVLSDFENQLEMSRWENSRTILQRTQEFTKTGAYSLRVSFLPGRYPNISLEHFINDWSDYKAIRYSIYNPSNKTHALTMKVYDKKNISRGSSYADRFNHKISVAPGWNTFNIPLIDIINAPKNRPIDMQQIKGFSLFTDHLKQPLTIYVDSIHLI